MSWKHVCALNVRACIERTQPQEVTSAVVNMSGLSTLTDIRQFWPHVSPVSAKTQAHPMLITL